MGNIQKNPVAAGSSIGMRQLFDGESSTYTYLLWDATTKDAILIDPVDTLVDRDLKVVSDEGLNLIYAINAHAHADHIRGTGILKTKVQGLKSIISAASKAQADLTIGHGDKIWFGGRYIETRETPGHTEGCISYVTDDSKMVFTGDAF